MLCVEYEISDKSYGNMLQVSSTLLCYISRAFGYRNIDDQHRNQNINIREIIWLGNQLHGFMLCIEYEISDESHGNMLQGMLQFILHI